MNGTKFKTLVCIGFIALGASSSYAWNWIPIAMIEGVEAPYFLDVDSTGNIYVAETKKNQITVYDPDGNIVNTINSSTVPGLGLSLPQGVAEDNGDKEGVRSPHTTVMVFTARDRGSKVPFGMGVERWRDQYE